MIREIGIIGFGSFGQFFGQILSSHFMVTVWDSKDLRESAKRKAVNWGTFKEVVSKEVVILALPLEALESTLKLIACEVSSWETLFIDVCSVKMEPIRLLREHLPYSSILPTHPLFGPQSWKGSFQGHKMAVCYVTPLWPKPMFMLDFFRGQGLDIIVMRPEDHDREMANVQALTHFIARALAEMRIEKSEFATTVFEHLMKVNGLLGGDSWELFKTIQNGNPFAADVRIRFQDALNRLERRLKD